MILRYISVNLILVFLLSSDLFANYVLSSSDSRFIPVSECSYSEDKTFIKVKPCFSEKMCDEHYSTKSYRCVRYNNSCNSNLLTSSESMEISTGTFGDKVIFHKKNGIKEKFALAEFKIEKAENTPSLKAEPAIMKELGTLKDKFNCPVP